MANLYYASGNTDKKELEQRHYDFKYLKSEHDVDFNTLIRSQTNIVKVLDEISKTTGSGNVLKLKVEAPKQGSFVLPYVFDFILPAGMFVIENKEYIATVWNTSEDIRAIIMAAQSNAPLYPKVRDLEGAANYWETEQYLLETEYQLTQYKQTQKIDKEFISTNYDAFGKELLAGYYAAKAEPDSLRQVITDIQNDSTQQTIEKEQTVNYLNTVATVLEQQQTLYTADNSLVNALPAIEIANTTKASVHANAALKARKQQHHQFVVADIIETTAINARLFKEDKIDETIITANTNNFVIYPNPNNGSFKIKFDKEVGLDSRLNITVTNLMGQVVLSKVIDSAHEINVSDLVKGIYITTIIQNESIIGQSKLIIE